MTMKYFFQNCFLLLLIALSSLGLACSTPDMQRPADFSVLSLEVDSSQTAVGKQLKVTADVINTGELPGNFTEPLLVNGVEADSKVTTILPNATKTLTYNALVKDPGEYILKLGNTTAKFVIPRMVEVQSELKYDNDKSRDALWAGTNGGFLIGFVPETTPFQVNKVRICGGIYGTAWEGKTFQLFLLGSDMKSVLFEEIYEIAKMPVEGAFPYRPPEWVDFDIPATVVKDKFYVYLYTNMNKHKGIHVGVDDSVINQYSDLAQGKPPYITIVEPGNVYPSSIWYADRSKLNWMIRVSGTSMVESQ
jgi:hypothetical protein